MSRLKEIQENLETISAFSTISNIYQSIAQMRMDRIREEVLKTRQFLEGLAAVYSLAKKAYLIASPQNTEEKLNRLLAKEKGTGTLAVFLSTNEFLAGPLMLNLWKEVRNYLHENKATLAVIGTVGKYLAESSGWGHKIMYFPLADENPSQQDLKEIVDFIEKYERVIIFHGRFESVINQQSVQTDISGGAYLEKETAQSAQYLFEPSPEKVLKFFENEIAIALFNQVILEHRLARYAARLIAMYQTTEKARQMEERISRQTRKIKREEADKKQIEFFGSLKLWR